MPLSRPIHLGLILASLFSAFLTLAFAIASVARASIGFGRYPRPAAELLAASVLLLFTSPLVLICFYRPRSPVDRVWFELVWIFILFSLFLGGSAALAANWDCSRGEICHLLMATQAFGWITFIFLFALLCLVIFKAVSGGSGFGGSAYIEKD